MAEIQCLKLILVQVEFKEWFLTPFAVLETILDTIIQSYEPERDPDAEVAALQTNATSHRCIWHDMQVPSRSQVVFSMILDLVL
jgi:hypothetical protein